MEPEHKKYILENIDTKSTAEIARDLRLKERKVKKFIQLLKRKKTHPEVFSAPVNTKIILSLIIIAVAGLAVYRNSLRGEFILDDKVLVQDNAYIKNFAYLPKVFVSDISTGMGTKSSFYRPLQTITYMIDYALWGLNVFGYHLTNIFLHILAACALCWLIYVLFKDYLLAFFTSILFVVHPIHTEAVSYISGRADSLSALFMLLCLGLYLKEISSGAVVFYILMILSYICALLSREHALILPFVLLLYHYAFKKKIKIRRFLPLAAIALAYILIRSTALKYLLVNIKSNSTALQRVPGFFVALAQYLRLLVAPFGLHMDYGNKLFNFSDPGALVGIILLPILLVCAFAYKKRNTLVFFAVSFFLLTLVVQSNIYPLNAYMAEHWLYLPSVGFFLILAKFLTYIYRLKNRKALAEVASAGLLIFYSFLTIAQNTYWKNDENFYKRTIIYVPDSHRAYNNLGNIYSKLGKKDQAIEFYEKALELKPDFEEACSNLGAAYATLGMENEAVVLYKKAIQINPNYAEAYNNLATLYAQKGNPKEAIPLYKKALELQPYNAETYDNLGLAYRAIGKYEEAVDAHKKAIKLSSRPSKAYSNLCATYAMLGKHEEAVESCRKAIEINSHNAEAYVNLGITYAANRNVGQAIILFRKAIEVDPQNADAYNNLGAMYASINKPDEAIPLYKKALELKPNNADTYANLGVVYFGKGKTNEAIEGYRRAIELNPGHAKAHSDLGIAYAALGKKEEALYHCKKAAEINPLNYQAQSNLGAFYASMGKTDEAIEAFKKAHEMNPEDPFVNNNLGVMYANAGRQEEALALYKKAIQINPNYADAYANLGLLYSAQGKYDDAINAYKKAVEINPGHAKAYFGLGIAYLAQDKNEEALVYLKKMLEINPSSADAYDNLGVAYSGLGKNSEAIDAYKKAIELNPNHAKAHNNLAVLYYNQKQYELAIEHCDKAFALGFKVHPEFIKALQQYQKPQPQTQEEKSPPQKEP